MSISSSVPSVPPPLLSVLAPLLSVSSPLLSVSSPLLSISSPLVSLSSPLLSVSSPFLSVQLPSFLSWIVCGHLQLIRLIRSLSPIRLWYNHASCLVQSKIRTSRYWLIMAVGMVPATFTSSNKGSSGSTRQSKPLSVYGKHPNCILFSDKTAQRGGIF